MRRILEEIVSSGILIEKEYEVKIILAGLLARGHVLLEGVPGVAKTTVAKVIARVLSLKFRRVQMTPDLLPMDILGAYIYDQKSGEFVFREGPIFTNLLLVDEINRASPRTQSALLEAMQERQVTIEGHTHKLEEPFMVIATQNPIEMEGVFPLPEAQLDRFLVKVETGYTSRRGFKELLKKIDLIETRVEELKPMISREELIEEVKKANNVKVDDSIYDYIVNVVEETRNHPAVKLGGSPRAGIAIVRLSKAWAYIHGREYVIPDDVKSVAHGALSHRLILKPEYEVMGITARNVIEEVLKKIEVPRP